jgi:DNA-directed RNA polymerase subunit RPC12/RpoP
VPFRAACAYLRVAHSRQLVGNVRIELNCAECGKNHFNLEEGFADHAVIYCNDCGHRIGTMAELKERVAAEVLRRSLTYQFDEVRDEVDSRARARP